MRTQQKRNTRKVRLDIGYGLGGAATGEFPRHQVAGKSAREVIQSVVELPQQPGPASRTAKVLADAIRTMRQIDAELINVASGKAHGEPIGLDDVVITCDDDQKQDESTTGQECEEIKIRCSESYRGGDGTWQIRRHTELG
jgi:hypothetical protein